MKILFASVSAPGHMNPLLSVARIAMGRGDETLFTASSHLADSVEASGARFVPLLPGADVDFREIEKVIPERATLAPGPELLRVQLERCFVDLMGPQADSLRRIIDAESPDVIVADSMFCGTIPLLLDRLRARPPIVGCGVTILPLDRPDGAPLGPGLPPARGEADRDRYEQVAAHADAAFGRPIRAYADARLAEMGLRALPHSFFQSLVLLPDAYLQPTVPAFEYDFGAASSGVHFIGALPPPPSRAARPEWWGDLDGPRKLVLVTQGTVANFDFGEVIEPTLAALADRDDLLVMATTGGRPIKNVRGPIPANARLATFLDFEALLPRLDALVTNGGYGTVSLALRAGVPIVCAGLTEDKAEIGTRIAWSGVGVNLASNSPGVDAVRDGVRRVLVDPSYREHARAMAADFAAINTDREVFAVLDRLAAVPAS